MRKFLARVERAIITVAVNPKLRPVEHELAIKVARSVLLRTGASLATSAIVIELVNRFLV